MAILGIAEYKAQIGYAASDRDVQYGFLTRDICAAIKNVCKQNIEQQSYTAYLDAPVANDLRLPQGPVQASGLSLSLCLNAFGDPSLFTSDTLQTNYADYLLDVDEDDATQSRSRIIRRTAGLFWGQATSRPARGLDTRLTPNYKAIKVTYTGGYAVIPADITLAATLAVSRLFNMVKKGVPMGSESLTGYSYSAVTAQMATSIIKQPDVWQYLAKYAKSGGIYIG